MKGYKKLTALFSAVLAVGLLAGCNGQPKTSSSSGPTTGTSTPSSTQPGPTSSSEPPHSHSLEFVDFVPSTKEEQGMSDYYECSVCHQLFDSLGNEVDAEDLVLPCLAENSIYDETMEHASFMGKALYTEDDPISKALIDNMYVIAVDGEGVIIYGGRFGGGYGGPGDGFYHDGSYAPVAGEICGIFDIDPEWAPWPGTTASGEPAWNLFDVVVPEDGFIVAGPQEDMVDFVTALLPEISSEEFLAETNNAIFETKVAKGKLNKDRVTLNDGDMFGQISLERTILEGIFLSLPTGTIKLEANEEGKYVSDFSLAMWGFIELYSVDAKGIQHPVFYDNTSVFGAVTAEDVTGADWTVRLYHETDRYGRFYSCTGGQYQIVYDPAETKLEIRVPDELIVSGSTTEYLIPTNDPVSYRVLQTLALWGGFILTKVSDDFSLVDLNHETASFTGDVVNTTDAPWNEKLYRDENNTSRYLTSNSAGGTYIINVTLSDDGDSVDITYVREGVSVESVRDFTANISKQEDGSYVIELTATNTWAKIRLQYTNANNETTIIYYDTAVLSGDFTGADEEGCQWNGKLYHEGNEKFFRSENPGAFRLVYTPAHDEQPATLTAQIVDTVVTAKVAGVPTVLTKNGNSYVADLTFAQWNTLEITVAQGFGAATEVWYNNADFYGAVTAADFEGVDDSHPTYLYHEAAQGNKWFTARANTIHMVYTPGAEKAMIVLSVLTDFDTKASMKLSVGDNSKTATCEEGVYSATMTLAQWNTLSIEFYDDTLVLKPYFDNCIIGSGFSSPAVNGCDWTDNLFHENGSYWLCYTPGDYLITYVVATHTLTAQIVIG